VFVFNCVRASVRCLFIVVVVVILYWINTIIILQTRKTKKNWSWSSFSDI